MFFSIRLARALACFSLATISLACSSSDSPAAVQPPSTQPDAADALSTADSPAEALGEDASEASPDVAKETAPSEASADGGKAALCATEFGTELISGYGRIDGTVLAVVGTQDKQCTLPNGDHVVVQVLMHGKAYRLVASVLSTIGDPNVGLLDKQAPLTAPAWSEGWHLDASLDYVTTLGVHTADFTGHPMLELEKLVVDQIEIGAKISVYATNNNSSYTDSAHLIHRNKTNQDGAIVVSPDSPNPKYLLFRFANQTF